nr:MAG TPA: hypothetical protein [Caudoviricetes sp.]
MGLLKIEHIFQSTQNCVQYKNMFAEGSKNISPKLGTPTYIYLPEEQTKKHAHKGRAILDDKKTNETRSINQFIRTREEQRNGYNNLKATHRLRIPNVLLL